jgi:hypothetical protein
LALRFEPAFEADGGQCRAHLGDVLRTYSLDHHSDHPSAAEAPKKVAVRRHRSGGEVMAEQDEESASTDYD